jgi:hypothetical protein
MDESTLAVVFTRRADLEAQLPHLTRGTFLVPPLEPEPKLGQALDVVFLAGGDESRFDAHVVQILPGAGIALEAGNTAAVRGWIQDVAPSLPDDGAPARSSWGLPKDDGQEAPAAEEEDTGAAAMIHERIRGMTANEKLKLALSGGKLERTLLLRDPNKSIQAHIIKNRRITLDEVRYIAGFRQASADVLKQISETQEWVGNPGILIALVSNPRTPANVALKLLKFVPVGELRRLAKSQTTPQAVSSAAKKMVVGK